MKSINYALRKAYYSLLSGITFNGAVVPVFYQQAPDDYSSDNYIVFGGITSNDKSGQYKASTDSSINVKIHTFRQTYNDGHGADMIAGEVLNRIYPNKQTHLDLSADGLQNISTVLSGDTTQPYNIMNNREYIDRILTFRHSIFHQ